MTVQGPNEGKWYYGCKKFPERGCGNNCGGELCDDERCGVKQCGFFKWEEETRALEKKYFDREALRRKTGLDSFSGSSNPVANSGFDTSGSFGANTSSGGNTSFGTDTSFGANTSFGTNSTLEANTSFGTNNTLEANTSFGTNSTLEASSPKPRSLDQQVSRRDTPQSEAASTIAGEQFYSPRSSVFPTPGPRRSIFCGKPRESDMRWSSDDDSDHTTNGRRQPSFDRNRGSVTPTPAKRKRAGAGKDTAIEISDPESDDAMQLTEMPNKADSSRRRQPQQQSQHSQLPSSNLTTPSKRRTRAGLISLPTPETGTSHLSASSRSSKRLKHAQGQSTPTPARNRDVLATSAGGLQAPGDYRCGDEDDDADITTAVLGLLSAEPVSAPVRHAVRETLNLHATRTRGVERGRDMLRDTLGAKNRRIAELQARVDKLESDRRMPLDVLKKAATDLLTLYEEGGVETREDRLLE